MRVRCEVKLLVQLGLQALLITVRLLLVFTSLKLHLHLKTRLMRREFSRSIMRSGVPSDFARELQRVYENRLKEETDALSFRRALRMIVNNLR